MAKELDPLPSSPLVVDVSHSLHHHLTNINHDAVDHAKVIKALKLSLESCGFLYINGCDTALGCDSLYVDNLFRLIGDYFSQPLSEKEKSISKDKARRGYSPSESDNFASLLLQSHTNTYANDTVDINYKYFTDIRQNDNNKYSFNINPLNFNSIDYSIK